MYHNLYDVNDKTAVQRYKMYEPQFYGRKPVERRYEQLVAKDGYKFVYRTENSRGIRCYSTGDGKFFPSVTSVLSANKDMAHIERWANRVGQKEAERIRNNSANRGSQMHRLCENYLTPNVPLFREDHGTLIGPSAVRLFTTLLPLLDEIDVVYGSEVKMISEKLWMAGTTDLIANFRGVPSIVDFKNARRIKSREEIEEYFLQETAYAVMAYEMFGFKAEQVVTMIAVEDNKHPLLYCEPVTKERIMKMRTLGYEYAQNAGFRT